MSNTHDVDALDLVVYTRSFAVLLGAGVSLVRILQILQEISKEPLSSATQEIFEQVSAGSTLSKAMANRPDIFSRLYTQMVRVGEVGGVLDETCAQVADLIESDWKDSQETDAECRGLLMPCGTPEGSFADAATDVRLRLLAVYFRSLGTMLTAGVPLAEGTHNALTTAAEMFPPGPERDALAAIVAQMEGCPVHAIIRHFDLPFVPPEALQLIAVGAETGSLPVMLDKIAQLLEYQRRYHLLKRASGG